MKNKILSKLQYFCIALAFYSCNKTECNYVVIEDCIEKEPEGFMVTTKEAFLNSEVAAIYKTTNNQSAPIGADWNNPALGAGQVQQLATPMWTTASIGNVFGIALDTKNIYLAATDVYTYDAGGSRIFGPGGASGIYKTDVNAPAVTTTLVSTLIANTGYTVGTNKIPNSGVGVGNSLGNIAYDKVNSQLFATNLEDGRIYRIDPVTGFVKSIFDPFVTDIPLNGMVAINERIWGIGVLSQNGVTEIYFAKEEATFSSIWSIKLDATGEFIATSAGGLTPKLFVDTASSSSVQIPKVGKKYFSNPKEKITDIEFSCSGKMLMAERGNAHHANVFEYSKTGTTWNVTNPFFTGQNSGTNSAGGVDYGGRQVAGKFIKDDIVWASENWASPVPYLYLVYGYQGISSTGNTATTNGSTDLFIDANSGGQNNKGGIGDVDIFDSSCPCNK